MMRTTSEESCGSCYSQNPNQYHGMAKFGQSFKDILMAEAMLEEEFRSTHVTECDDLQATYGQEENDNNTDNSNEARKAASPSALKTTSGYNNTNDDGKTGPNPRDGRPSPEKKSEMRSVVIQVPPKRQRIAGNSSAADIVQALNRAMSPEERWEALENAVATFDHDDRDIHDNEIAAGADIALTKALVFLEFKSGFRREPIQADMEAITREIGMVLKALECVYRASSESVGESFTRVGTDLLHILVILIDDEVKNRLQVLSPDTSPASGPSKQDDADSPSVDESDSTEDQKRSMTPPILSPWGKSVGSYDRDIMIRKATKVLGHFARVGKATKPMAHFPGFLGSTLNLINMRPYPTIPFEARLSCLWTIANLACNTENMTMMMCTPNLVNSLISISSRQPDSGDTLEALMEILRAKSIASRALLNLSWSPENKILMSENRALVQVLSRLALERQAPYKRSKTMQDILVQTRRNSIGALRNMAASPRRTKIALCEYNNGKLLDDMTDVALNETDKAAVDLAFAAIHNLAIHDIAEAIVERPALVLALKNVLLEDDDDAEEPPKNSRKSHASSTILVLERTITPEMPSYENLRELLDAINPTNPTDDDNDMITTEVLNATAV